MRALKALGVVAAVFLLLGFGFIEPSRTWQDASRVVMVLVGVALCTTLAVWGVRRVWRQP